jgi:hypothetical protein
VNPTVPEPGALAMAGANTSHQVFLSANTLTLASPGRILQQSTSGTQNLNGSGIYLTGNVVLAAFGGAGATPGAGPANFDLYVAFANPIAVPPLVPAAGSGVLTGSATAVAPRFTLPGTVSNPNSRVLWRVNGCVIGEQGNCTPTGNPVTNFLPSALLQGPLLQQPDNGDYADPTITGAANEEIWRKPD